MTEIPPRDGFYDDLANYGTAVRDGKGRHVPLSEVVLDVGAEMMSKADTIRRREEALEMLRFPLMCVECDRITS